MNFFKKELSDCDNRGSPNSWKNLFLKQINNLNLRGDQNETFQIS